MPRFSVIIPTYNRATVLPAAIRSVQAQSFRDWELIIVDDGSTDDTAVTVKPFLSDERIRYHWQENKELNGARNAGVELTTGEFICFLDDDDLYLQGHLDTLDELITAKGNRPALYRSGMIIKRGSKNWKSVLYYPEEHELLPFIWSQNLGITTFAFPCEIFKNYRFAEQYVLADDLHFLMQAGIAYPLFQAHAYTVVYHKHEAARTATYYQPDRLKNKLACLEEILSIDSSHLASIKTRQAKRRLYAQEHLYFARAAFNQGDSLGWQYYREAWGYFQPALLKSYLYTLYQGLRRR